MTIHNKIAVDRGRFPIFFPISLLFLLLLRVFLMDANPILPDFQELLVID
jgi:hypothetical protein